MSDCPPDRQFFLSGACSVACPDAAPIPNTSNVCEEASGQGDCPPDRQFFLSGACSVACPTTARVSHNSVCMEMCPDAAPVSNNNVCEEASGQGDCPADRPFFLSGSCRAACPTTASVSHNSVCMEMCPDAAPMPGTNNVCRARVASDCTDDTRPVLDSDGTTCRGRGTDDGMGTVALSLVGATGTEGTDVVFAEMIGQDDTAAYNEISAAAGSEPSTFATVQSGNCGSPCTRTLDSTGIDASATGGNVPIDEFIIDKDVDTPSSKETFSLTQGVTTPMVAPTTVEMDRRVGLTGGWPYRRYELTGTEVDGDESRAEADIIQWSDGNDDYYLAGGVWAYDIGEPDMENPTDETRGASTNFNSVAASDINVDDRFPKVGSATYTGHSFGYYTTLPAPAGETENRGYFAANARLVVDFANASAGVSGTISNFLFSTDRGFTTESPLEAALSGLSVELEAGEITRPNPNFVNAVIFRGDTRATGVMVDGEMLTLRGEYGGLFYEAQGKVGSADAPLAVGGTWGAAGTTATAPMIGTDGGFGIAFIGAFGVKRCRGDTPILGDDGVCRRAENNAECANLSLATPIADNGACRAVEAPAETMFTIAPSPDNHAQYEAVADHLPLFGNGTADDSSVTLGSVAVNDTTDDRVWLTTGAAGLGTGATFLNIDVDDDGSSDSGTSDISRLLTAGAGDRRTTELGESGNTSDPSWRYVTATFGSSQNIADGDEAPDAANEYRAFVVDWTSDANNYLGGGVWARATGTNATDVQFGAFVDGTNPTDADDTDGDADDLNDATGMATYRGHAYGRYSLNNGIAEDPNDPNDENDANPGFFAAKAVLNADFGTDSEDGTISGRIHNFLFSQNNSFDTDNESELEDAIGGAERFAVTLQEATIDNNTFNAAAAGSRIQLLGASGELLDPVGQWGGRFYGTPAEDSGDAPQLVGGVFAVADDNTTDSSPGTVSFSIIGSFGAKR